MTALRGSEAELEMAAALSSHYGSLPLVGGIYHRTSSEAADGDSVPEGQEMSGKAFDGDPSDGHGTGTMGSTGGPMFPSHLDTANLTASYVQALLLARYVGGVNVKYVVGLNCKESGLIRPVNRYPETQVPALRIASGL